jgi:hypothetical protein
MAATTNVPAIPLTFTQRQKKPLLALNAPE